MNRKLLSRFIMIVVLILVALWQLYPTFNLSRLTERQEEKIARLQALVDISRDEIKTALVQGSLEAVILGRVNDKASEKQARQLAVEIQKLEDKIFETEKKAIKRGLDLQGGTYLVYEINFPQFLYPFTQDLIFI